MDQTQIDNDTQAARAALADAATAASHALEQAAVEVTAAATAAEEHLATAREKHDATGSDEAGLEVARAELAGNARCARASRLREQAAQGLAASTLALRRFDLAAARACADRKTFLEGAAQILAPLQGAAETIARAFHDLDALAAFHAAGVEGERQLCKLLGEAPITVPIERALPDVLIEQTLGFGLPDEVRRRLFRGPASRPGYGYATPANADFFATIATIERLTGGSHEASHGAWWERFGATADEQLRAFIVGGSHLAAVAILAAEKARKDAERAPALEAERARVAAERAEAAERARAAERRDARLCSAAPFLHDPATLARLLGLPVAGEVAGGVAVKCPRGRPDLPRAERCGSVERGWTSCAITTRDDAPMAPLRVSCGSCRWNGNIVELAALTFGVDMPEARDRLEAILAALPQAAAPPRPRAEQLEVVDRGAQAAPADA